MKLISDIINELMDHAHPIAGPLLKTKVLAARIGNAELSAWVDNEINGYCENGNTPDYRRSSGILMGTFVNGNKQYSRAQVPLGDITDEERHLLTDFVIKDSISSVEKMQESKDLKISVSADAKAFIEHSVRSLGNRFFEILVVYIDVPSALFANILAIVRSKLLDFMLAIEHEFGQETELEDLRAKNKLINQIMHTTINNNGDGNVINTGTNARISASNTIIKGNAEALKHTLKEHGVQDQDIDDLLLVIDEVQPEQPNTYSPNVAQWIKNMVGKSLDGTWQIGIGAAGTLLAEALTKYYGL